MMHIIALLIMPCTIGIIMPILGHKKAYPASKQSNSLLGFIPGPQIHHLLAPTVIVVTGRLRFGAPDIEVRPLKELERDVNTPYYRKLKDDQYSMHRLDAPSNESS